MGDATAGSLMARPASKYPTELELQILKVLWQASPLLARDVQGALAGEGRELAKTSIITTLNTMVAKRYLSRVKQGNMYLFSPRITESEVGDRVLGDVVDRVFDGSTSAVLLKLFDVKDLDADELKELRRIIDRKLKNP
jgi:BlaI family penicillinase repressor